MRNKGIKPSLDKFKIAELKRPEVITGGGDDDGTISSSDKKKICIMNSTRYVDPPKR